MRIVVDTNVVISAIFFGGTPRKVIEAVADGAVEACYEPRMPAAERETLRRGWQKAVTRAMSWDEDA